MRWGAAARATKKKEAGSEPSRKRPRRDIAQLDNEALKVSSHFFLPFFLSLAPLQEIEKKERETEAEASGETEEKKTGEGEEKDEKEEAQDEEAVSDDDYLEEVDSFFNYKYFNCRLRFHSLLSRVLYRSSSLCERRPATAM